MTATLSQVPAIHDGTSQPGVALMTRIRAALASAGLPRTSPYRGGEVTGFITNIRGSTGFSVQLGGPTWQDWYPKDSTHLHFHVVVSGKVAGVRYERYREWLGESTGVTEAHRPLDAEKLNPRIRTVFESLGFHVCEVKFSGHQTMWDDDLEYLVVTTTPAGWKV